MDLLQKSKYSHLRNESVSSAEEAAGVPVSPAESPSSSLAPLAPLGDLSPESEDSPTTFCSFFPKMANLKLSNPANLLNLRGSSSLGGDDTRCPPGVTPGGAAGTDSMGPVAVCPQDMNKLSCGKKTRVEGGQLGGDEWTRHGSFVNKPTRGWLHPDDKVMGPGVSYHVRVSPGGPEEGLGGWEGSQCGFGVFLEGGRWVVGFLGTSPLQNREAQGCELGRGR